jgi:hypothetical protein
MHGREMNTKCWFENLKTDHLEEIGMDGTIILKWTLYRTSADAVVEWILVMFHIQKVLGSNLSQ